MSPMRTLCGVFVVLCAAAVFAEQPKLTEPPQPRPEFKHSTKPPYYMVRSTSIPFWDFGSSTVITEDYIRLTPSIRNRSGWLWNKRAASMNAWEVTFHVKITGSKKAGSHGMAFWYAEQTRSVGQAYGSLETFKGLGVFLDTYDNRGNGDSPIISGMVSDGSVSYNPDTDGVVREAWSCQENFRNTGYQFVVRVRYQDRRVEVQYASNPHAEFSTCFIMNDIDLPIGYFFGFSASTGQIADMHDIYSVQTVDLEPMTYDQILDQIKNRKDETGEKEPEKDSSTSSSSSDKDAATTKSESGQGKSQGSEEELKEAFKALAIGNADGCAGLSDQVSNLYEELKKLRQDFDHLKLSQDSLREISTLQAEINQRISTDFGKFSSQMDSLSDKVSAESDEVAGAVRQLNGIIEGHGKDLSVLRRDVGQVLSSDSGRQNIMTDLAKDLGMLKSTLKSTDRQSQRIVDDLERKMGELNSSIESSSSSTWWTFIFVALVFAAGIGYFIYSDQKRKKQMFF